MVFRLSNAGYQMTFIDVRLSKVTKLDRFIKKIVLNKIFFLIKWSSLGVRILDDRLQKCSPDIKWLSGYQNLFKLQSIIR
jgi:hypothetical protein